MAAAATHPLKLHLALEPLVRQHLAGLLPLALRDQRNDLAAQRILVARGQLEDWVARAAARGREARGDRGVQLHGAARHGAR